MDQLGLFFKALPRKVLIEKTKQRKDGQKLKQLMTALFTVATDGSFVFKSVVIWRSKVPRCFRSMSRSMSVHYFPNSKAWMKSNIMETVFGRLGRRMNFENHKVILFLDNATCQPDTRYYKKF